MKPQLALVLAGGGARGAYEAGVLRFILGDLPKRIGHPVAADFICGSSVGAINGAAIGAWNGSAEGPKTLSKFWTSLACSDVYRFVALDLLRSPMRVLRGPSSSDMAWVDARPLHALIRETFPWAKLRQSIDSGRLSALVLTATEISTGRCIQFIDGNIDPESLEIHTGIRRAFIPVGPEHVLASCAIPFLFPPVEINGQPMVDGSLRQNTPLSPAIRLGADHVLVVGTRRPRSMMVAPEGSAAPSTPTILGKALNALLLDPVHQDLARVELINKILNFGTDEFGADFIDRLNASLGDTLSRRLRPIDTLCIYPSEDLGRMASEIYDPSAIQATRGTRFMLSTVAGDSGESDLLSYLLFDGSYTQQVEDLGYQDALARETEIISFLERTYCDA
jgi:NTE family protein